MLKRAIAALAFTVAAAVPVQAADIDFFEAGVPKDIPGLTGFMTFGDMMDGLAITACFSGPVGCEVRAWADGGAPGSGFVAGTGWGLSLTGDTFVSDWDFTMTPSADLGQLISLLLDGRDALTLFDRTFGGSSGTAGSASGLDFFTTLNDGTEIDVTYLDPTGIGIVAPVGDIFQQVFIQFMNQSGPRDDWSFVQDTDNDSRFQVPEPTTLLLLGLGVLALVRVSRRS